MGAHFKKTAANRKGYFKKKTDNPTPDYKGDWEKNTSRKGFRGGRTEVHHILPWEAIDWSIQKVPAAKLKYVEDVQWITDWNINADANVMGLPTVHSYQIAAETALKALQKLSPTQNEALKRYAATFNKWPAALRQRYFTTGGLPDTYAIHNPRSWGHPEFSKLVSDEIYTRVWQPLDEKKKDHDVDAATVAQELNDMSGERMGTLTGRAGATRQAWIIQNTQGNAKWYEPFVMAPVKKAPL